MNLIFQHFAGLGRHELYGLDKSPPGDVEDWVPGLGWRGDWVYG